MSDVMTFPATFEEFAKTYKIIDSEQIYTNGTELIPIFRVKQWLEHKSTLNLTDKDKDIIKALEWCLIGKGQCSECPLTNIPLSKCRISLYRDILDLINRQQKDKEKLQKNILKYEEIFVKQQAEINRLTKRNFELAEKGEKVVVACKSAKTDAVKEFAERLKDDMVPNIDDTYIESFVEEYIDTLVKEIIGE